jgi:hypothetical protein
MLRELIEIRDNALNEYCLTECTKNLGLYNRAVNNLTEYLNSQQYLDDVTTNRELFTGDVDPHATDYESLGREKPTDIIDISDIDVYNLDFELED